MNRKPQARDERAAEAEGCADALTLAQFWADVLGRQVAEDPAAEHVVLLADGTDAVKNRLHLDLISDTFDAEARRLPSLSVRRLRDVQTDKARWTTFADIEGNEFDLIAG